MIVGGPVFRRVLALALLAFALGLSSPGAAFQGPRPGGGSGGPTEVRRGPGRPPSADRPQGIRRENPAPGSRSRDLSPDKIERWKNMSPAERDRVRERFRRWKTLPPEERDRVIERSRRWRELPERDRQFLTERREIFRNASPDEKNAVRKFFGGLRELPPDARRDARRRIFEMRDLPPRERADRLRELPAYRRMDPRERRMLDDFFFSDLQPPGRATPAPGPGAPPARPRVPSPGPPRD